MSSPSDPVLIALLDKPLPRGMRCRMCRRWDRDADGSSWGWCSEGEEETASHWVCVYWQPVDDCGLDYMGVPLASPLAQED